MSKAMSTQRARVRALFSYHNALERGDFETVSHILKQAERDPLLEKMIADMEAAAEIPIEQPETNRRTVHKSDGIEQIITVRRPSSDGQTSESDHFEEDNDMFSTTRQEFEQFQPRPRSPYSMRWLTLIAAVLVVVIMGLLTIIVFRSGFVSNPLLLGQVEPTPTPSPTPIPTPQVITRENADKLELLQVFGYGAVYDLEWGSDGTAITLLTDKNYIAQFDPDQLDKPPHIIQPIDAGGQARSYLNFAFSPDDELLAISQIQMVSVYDRESGTERASIRQLGISPLTFSPDGKILVGSSRIAKKIFLWDAATGEELHQLSDEAASANTLAFNPDGSILAAGYTDKQVRLWEVATGTLLATFTGHTNEVMTVTFREEGKSIASVDKDGRILLWDWKAITGAQRITLKSGGQNINWAAFSPDGNLLATAGDDPAIQLWDMNNATEKGRLIGHTDVVKNIAFNPEGSQLVSYGSDEKLRLWDVVTSTEVGQTEIAKGHTQILMALISPDGKTLASGSFDTTIRLWDVATGNEKVVLTQSRGQVLRVSISPDGQTLASSGADHNIRLWDMTTGELRLELEGHRGQIDTIVFSPDGKQLASSSSDRTARLWDLETGESQVIRGNGVWGIAYSADGTTLIFSGLDRRARLWDLTTNTERIPLTPSPISNGAFSSSLIGSWVTFSGGTDLVWLWNYATGESRALKGHVGSGEGNFSPDGNWFVSADYGSVTMRLWEVATAIQLSTYPTNGWTAFSPDGRKIIVGTYDGAIELWGVPMAAG